MYVWQRLTTSAWRLLALAREGPAHARHHRQAVRGGRHHQLRHLARIAAVVLPAGTSLLVRPHAVAVSAAVAFAESTHPPSHRACSLADELTILHPPAPPAQEIARAHARAHPASHTPRPTDRDEELPANHRAAARRERAGGGARQPPAPSYTAGAR
eukprot:893184-Prymnesium_polylepis.1